MWYLLWYAMESSPTTPRDCRERTYMLFDTTSTVKWWPLNFYITSHSNLVYSTLHLYATDTWTISHWFANNVNFNHSYHLFITIIWPWLSLIILHWFFQWSLSFLPLIHEIIYRSCHCYWTKTRKILKKKEIWNMKGREEKTETETRKKTDIVSLINIALSTCWHLVGASIARNTSHCILQYDSNYYYCVSHSLLPSLLLLLLLLLLPLLLLLLLLLPLLLQSCHVSSYQCYVISSATPIIQADSLNSSFPIILDNHLPSFCQFQNSFFLTYWSCFLIWCKSIFQLPCCTTYQFINPTWSIISLLNIDNIRQNNVEEIFCFHWLVWIVTNYMTRYDSMKLEAVTIHDLWKLPRPYYIILLYCHVPYRPVPSHTQYNTTWLVWRHTHFLVTYHNILFPPCTLYVRANILNRYQVIFLCGWPNLCCISVT